MLKIYNNIMEKITIIKIKYMISIQSVLLLLCNMVFKYDFKIKIINKFDEM